MTAIDENIVHHLLVLAVVAIEVTVASLWSGIEVA